MSSDPIRVAVLSLAGWGVGGKLGCTWPVDGLLSFSSSAVNFLAIFLFSILSHPCITHLCHCSSYLNFLSILLFGCDNMDKIKHLTKTVLRS